MSQLKTEIDVIIYDILEQDNCGYCNHPYKNCIRYKRSHLSVKDPERIKQILKYIGYGVD